MRCLSALDSGLELQGWSDQRVGRSSSRTRCPGCQRSIIIL